jgi:hypothetical protein
VDSFWRRFLLTSTKGLHSASVSVVVSRRAAFDSKTPASFSFPFSSSFTSLFFSAAPIAALKRFSDCLYSPHYPFRLSTSTSSSSLALPSLHHLALPAFEMAFPSPPGPSPTTGGSTEASLSEERTLLNIVNKVGTGNWFVVSLKLRKAGFNRSAGATEEKYLRLRGGPLRYERTSPSFTFHPSLTLLM